MDANRFSMEPGRGLGAPLKYVKYSMTITIFIFFYDKMMALFINNNGITIYI